MKKINIAVLCMAGALQASAQEKAPSTWFMEGGLKSNLLGGANGYLTLPRHTQFTPYFSIGRIVNKRWWHSVQLTHISRSSGPIWANGGFLATNPGNVTSLIPIKGQFEMGLSYQGAYELNHMSRSKFRFLIGGELAVNYQNGLVRVNDEYGRGNCVLLEASIVPKVIYNINKRVFLTASLPINAAQVKMGGMKQFDANGSQTNTYSGMEGGFNGPVVGIRLGIGIRF